MIKSTKYVLPAMLGAAMLLSSCAEDPVAKIKYDIKNTNLADQVDYTEFQNLKDAVAGNVNISGVMKASEIVDGGTSKIIATKNFTEVQMADFSHASFCKKDGTVSFTDLKAFVRAANKGGFSVYGGPIMSNTGVNKDYLAKVIQNKVDDNAEPFYETKEVERKCIKIETKDKVFQNWDTQFWIVTKDGFKKDDSFVFTAEVRADIPVTIGASTHSKECFYIDWQANFQVPFTEKWKKIEVEGTFKADGGSVAMDLNNEAKANVYYFDNVSFKINGKEQITDGDFSKGTEHEQFRRIAHYEGASDGHDNDPRTAVPIISIKGLEDVEVPAGPYTLYKNGVVNSDIEGDDFSDLVAKIYPATDPSNVTSSFVSANEGKDGSKCLKFDVPAKVTNPWDSQFWIKVPEGAEVGTAVKVEFDYKAQVEAKVSVQTHKDPGSYLGGANGLSDLTFKTDWQHYSGNFNVVADAGSIAFLLNEIDGANVYYWDNIEIKIAKDTLIGGIPLTAEEKKDTLSKYLASYIEQLMAATPEVSVWDAVVDPLPAADPEAVDFDWGSLLGDDYPAAVTKAVKQFYAGENAGDLKFFIAVSNAQEGNNVKAVVDKLAAYEKAGATIDGINAQVTLDLEGGKEGIDEMIKALAASGKMVKISFMGFSEILGSDLSVAADLINYLALKYTTVIDSSKQYGFSISNMNSTVWSSKFERTEVYKGLVLGLQGKAL